MSARLAKARPQEVKPEKPRPSEQDMERWIAEAAYYRAERRGFQPGMEAEDWRAAEAEIHAQLST